MSPHRTPLTLLLLLTTFLFRTSAYPSCSSLTAKSPLSSIPPDNLFKGCSIEAHDQFQRQYSLLDPLERPYSFNFHSNHTKNFHISLTPSSNTHLDIEITSPDEKSRHSIPFPASSLILISVSQGHLTVSVGDSPPIFSYNLTYSFPYTFSVQQPSPNRNSLTANHHMFRLLEQCPEGYVLLEGTCGKVCPAKQFNSKGVCTRCPEKCYTGRCISETTCNPCNSSEVYHEQSNTCLEKCPTSYFEDYNNKICIRCADGCASCSFPYGTCSATYFKSDMLINLIVSLVLLALITLCACFCNKETPDPSKTTQEQQPSQTDSQNPENLAKGKSDHIKKVIGVDPKAPYLVLPEGFDSEDHDHSGNGEFPDRRKKKRLTEYAESRFLSVSLSKRGFMIDDADEDKAISHGSATLKGRGPGSFSSLTSKTNSPLFPTKRRSSKSLLPSSLRPKGKSQINVDETMTPKQNSYGDVASPFSVLVAKKETSLGLMAVKKDPTLYLDSQEEEQETVKLDIQFKMAPLELPEAEEIEEVDEEERKEKEGYQNDSSLNMSKDGEVAVDMYACTICGMNKRDCLNRPCGHFVGCYACMEQFKESYGVCPRCKKLLVSIEKMEKK